MRAMILLVLWLGAISAAPQKALAQVAKATIGAGVGAMGGAVITMSIVVARARFQGVYMDSSEDLIHWQTTPMILTPAVGMFFGVAGKEPLRASIIGSTSGLVLGAAIGTGIGLVASSSPEGPWAGGAIGAGAGMTVGGLVLGLRAWLRSRDEGAAALDEEPTRVELLRFRL